MSGAIVVGVDGSRASVDALRWALAEAAGRRCAVEVVTAWPHTGPVFLREVPGHHSDARERARLAQDEALRQALGGDAPDVAIRVVLENARPEQVLAARAEVNDLLVLGTSRDTDDHDVDYDVEETLAERCQAEVTCPVVVVAPGPGAARVLHPPLARARG